MTTSAFLTDHRALIGTALGAPSGSQYPQTSTFMFWPDGVTNSWPSGALANYNRHKEMWGGRTPQMIRLYQNSPSATTGVTGSAGAYGFISSDWRSIANDGAFLNISFKYGSVSTSGMQAIANNLNAAGDNSDKQAMRNVAQNLRRWSDDTGNTASVKKITIGFHHEPENDGVSSAAYVACSRAIIDYLARRGVHDSTLSPITLGRVSLDGSSAAGGAVTSAYDVVEWAWTGMGWQVSNFDFWPGDAYCKWAYVDPYNWGGGQSSPTGTGANVGLVPQPGDTAGSNYTKSWIELKQPCLNLLNWSDSHPNVLLGLGEFATSEAIDRFPVSGGVLVSPRQYTAIPALKGEWYRQVARFAQGLASEVGTTASNVFTAEPRATRIKAWLYWPGQAAMPRWYNTVPFQVGDVSAPSTAGAARSTSYDGFVAMVTDPWFDVIGGSVVVNPSVTITADSGATARDYTFTATGTAGSSAITSFTFDFGDGADPVVVAGAGPAEATHTYAADGLFNVRVTVDASGDGGTFTRGLALVVAGVPDTTDPQFEPVTGAPLIPAGNTYEIANLRFIYNPGMLAVGAAVKDASTKRGLRVVSATSYTLVPDDAGRVLEFTAATAVTVTIPPNSSTVFPLGAYVDLVQMGAGQVTVTAPSEVGLSTANLLATRARYSTIRVLQRALVDSWLLSGDLATGTGSGVPGGGITPTTDDLFTLDFNGGVNGSALSTTPWTTHTGADATYSTDAIESLSGYWNLTAQSSYYRRDLTTPVALGWFSFYVKLSALPAAAVFLMQWNTGATKVGDLRVATNGALQLRDNVTQVIASTSLLAASTWARVSVNVEPGSVTGHALKVYQGADLHTMTATYSGTGAATSAAQTVWDRLTVGAMTSSTLAFRMDRLRGNSTVEPSPYPV